MGGLVDEYYRVNFLCALSKDQGYLTAGNRSNLITPETVMKGNCEMESFSVGERVFHAADKGRTIKTAYTIEGFPESTTELEKPVLCRFHVGQHQFLAVFQEPDLSHR